MFRLDMDAIREASNDVRLMANAANPANGEREISQKPLKLATLAGLATSHDPPALLTARLIAAAMRCCDHHGDSKAGRDQMRVECLATPPALQADLLTHFNQTYPESKT